MERDEIIAELQRVANEQGTPSLSQRQFKQSGRIGINAVENVFGNWNRAIEAAGLTPIPPGGFKDRDQKYSEEEYLLEIIRLTQEFGKPPTIRSMNAFGRFSDKPYRTKWGSLQAACQIAYATYGVPEAVSVISSSQALSEIPAAYTTNTNRIIKPQTYKPHSNDSRKKVQFGEPLDFRGLRFAPINEQGVVYVFGMISHELGFLVESVRTAFPDCEGKRCVDASRQRWEHVLIEFEYRSSNFLEHGHSVEGCDLIVCWIHDWGECPIEVLELRSVIKQLPGGS